jgi:hypothetical protein
MGEHINQMRPKDLDNITGKKRNTALKTAFGGVKEHRSKEEALLPHTVLANRQG